MRIPSTLSRNRVLQRDHQAATETVASGTVRIRDGAVIFNPRAGRGRHLRQLEQARRVLANGGLDTELWPTSGPADAMLLARRAVAESRQLVIVCGGDGTINEAVNGLAGSRVPLAILPAGTANVLAKELAIPWNLPRAAQRLLDAPQVRIALGLAVPDAATGPPRYFLSVAGAGPDAALVAGVDPKIKQRAGLLAYWHEGFRQLAKYSFPRFRVTTGEHVIEATLVVIGRVKHHGGPFQITTEASLLRPEFELAVVTARNSWRYLGYLPMMSLGQLRRASGVQFCKTAALECTPLDATPVPIQVDGEPVGSLSANFRIVPDALTLLAPEPL